MGKTCSKIINAINELPKQKEFHCLMKEEEEENGYLLIDIDFWNEPDCLICLDEVKYEEPKCINCHINGCSIISHAKCMNRWYQENKSCPICHCYLSKIPNIHFIQDTKNIAKKII